MPKVYKIPNPQRKNFPDDYKIRVARSRYIYILRNISLTVFYVLFVFVNGYLMFYTFDTFGMSLTFLVLVFILLASFPIFLGTVIYIYYRWRNHYYIIMPSAVIERKGVFMRSENNFACNRIERVNVSQTVLGRIFNFGTISLYDPFLETYIRFRDISDPLNHAKILKNIYVFQDKKNLSEGEQKLVSNDLHQPGL